MEHSDESYDGRIFIFETDCVHAADQKAVMITQMQTPSAHRGLTQPYTDTHAHKHFIFCSSLSVSKQLIQQLAGFFYT